jgi:tetratricopeptide (TPR) repeat protein
LKVFYRIRLCISLAWMAFAVTLGLHAQTGTRADALALEQQGRNAEAQQIWQSLTQSAPRNPEAFAHLGLLEARQQHYDTAVAFYRQALALDPSLPGLEMNLGLALFKDDKFQESVKPFTIELRRHPGDQRLTTLLGMAHYGMGDYLVAIPYLRRAAEKDPQNLPLRLTLAHSCMWSKQYQCVLDVYREILALNAESAEADMLAGEALDEKHDSTGAIEQFRSAVKANPKEPNVHFGLGYLLWTQRQYEEAAREFQAEIENDPQHAQSLEYLGDTYVELRNYPQAQAELEKAVAAAPASSLAHRDLGIVYVEIGRQDDAVHELQRAAALDPADVAPHWRLARLYQSMGRKDDAKVEFTKASTMNKQTNEALYKKMAGGPSAHPQ